MIGKTIEAEVELELNKLKLLNNQSGLLTVKTNLLFTTGNLVILGKGKKSQHD